MVRRRRRFAVLWALAALTLVGAACSGEESPPAAGEDGSSTMSQAPTEEPSDLPSVDIGGGELPDGFPRSFPLPDGAELAGSASAGGTYIVWFTSADDDVDDLRSYFADELPANGWTVVSEVDVDQVGVAYHGFVIDGNGYTGGIYIGEGAPGSEQIEGDFAFWVQLTPT